MQVHRATAHDGRQLAVKVTTDPYPLHILEKARCSVSVDATSAAEAHWSEERIEQGSIWFRCSMQA